MTFIFGDILQKGMNPQIPASYALNSIITILFQGWFWH